MFIKDGQWFKKKGLQCMHGCVAFTFKCFPPQFCAPLSYIVYSDTELLSANILHSSWWMCKWNTNKEIQISGIFLIESTRIYKRWEIQVDCSGWLQSRALLPPSACAPSDVGKQGIHLQQLRYRNVLANTNYSAAHVLTSHIHVLTSFCKIGRRRNTK